MNQRQEAHKNNRLRFIFTLIGLQIAIIILYGIFVRVRSHKDETVNLYYPMFQDVNVMMLIGFGFLMTFIKRYTWSALSYTFFINAIVFQLYPLMQGFWSRVFHATWTQREIYLEQKVFTSCSYSVASILIAFGGVLGKVGPFQLLIMSLVGLFGYTLNQDIIYNVLYCFDAGGSMPIHTYGAYFGLTVSFILSKKTFPTKKAETTPINSTFAMIGTFFLWMFWPSFNAGYFASNPLQKSLIISNTIISLTGSCLAAFIVSGLIREKFSIEDILNATLAGGVAIGAPSGMVANPGISLTIGVVSGIISTLGYAKLTEFLYDHLKLHDTCGVHNLHGIPGLIGGWTSAMVIASFQTYPGLDSSYSPYISFTPLSRTLSAQAGIQVAGTFISLGIGIGFGIITGLFLYFFYDFRDQQFFEDSQYFEVPTQREVQMTGYSNKITNKNKLQPISIKINENSQLNLGINLDV